MNSGELRQLCVDLWRRTRIDWSFAGAGLQAALRARPGLNSTTRRWLAEVVYGLIRHLRRVDAGLAAGGVRATTGVSEELRIITFLMLEGPLTPQDAVHHSANIRAARDVDWQAVAAVDPSIDAERKRWRRVALKCSLPDWLAKRLAADLGDQALAFGTAVNRRGPVWLRANVQVNSAAELAAALAAEGIDTTPGRHASNALRVHGHPDLRRLGLFARGAFELQDEASQVVAELAFAPGVAAGDEAKPMLVDYCAGAGGKTLAWASRLGNRGRLIACDTDPRKLAELRKRARRANASNIRTLVLDPTTHTDIDELRDSARCVLVDAPCSGLGALRRHPETRWRLSAADIDRLSKLQARILADASALVAPGGVLLYATCTVLRAENSRVVDNFLSAHRTFALRPVTDVWPERAPLISDTGGNCVQMTPHQHDTDGFFAAVLQRATV